MSDARTPSTLRTLVENLMAQGIPDESMAASYRAILQEILECVPLWQSDIARAQKAEEVAYGSRCDKCGKRSKSGIVYNCKHFVCGVHPEADACPVCAALQSQEKPE